MPFNVKAARLETFHDACQGRTLTFEAALTSDDLELVDAAAWACPLDLLLRQREQVCEDHNKGLDIGQRGPLICYAADVRGTSEDAPTTSSPPETPLMSTQTPNYDMPASWYEGVRKASAEAERARAKLASPEPAPACPVCDLQEGHPLCFCESLQPCAT